MKTSVIAIITSLFLMIPGFNWAQAVSISGYVNNSISGEALENVNIFETNSGIGTISNQNGFYKLVLSTKNVQIKISSEGFDTYTEQFTLLSDTTLIVKLKPVGNMKRRQKKEAELQAGAQQETPKFNRRRLR